MSEHLRRRWGAVLLAGLLLGSSPAGAQLIALRYNSHREVAIPEYATVRAGPFYSTLTWQQTIGYRYVDTAGSGAARLYNNDLGVIKKDGSDFPLYTTLNWQNYLILTPSMDLEIGLQLTYRYYPLNTADDELTFNLADTSYLVQYNNLTVRSSGDTWAGTYAGDNYNVYATDQSGGLNANLSSDFTLTEFLKGRIYDAISYRVDYVDARGRTDYQNGSKYQVFQNIAGLDLDWLMARDKNMALTLTRTDTIPTDETTYKDQRSEIYRGGLAYEQMLTENLLVGLRAGYTYRHYIHSTRGTQFQQEYEGFSTIQLTARSELQIALGYATADLDEAGLYETEGSTDSLIGRAKLKTQLHKDLSHAISYTRNMTGGYAAGLEVTDEARYSIDWDATRDIGVGLSTAYQSVEPRLTAVTPYVDWVTQLSVSWQALKDLKFDFATSYSIRDNGPITTNSPNASDPTVAYDYDVWSALLGATYQLTQAASLAAYIQHTAEFSDAEELRYTRDIYGINFTFSYTF
jgi:hypothetical protein